MRHVETRKLRRFFLDRIPRSLAEQSSQTEGLLCSWSERGELHVSTAHLHDRCPHTDDISWLWYGVGVFVHAYSLENYFTVLFLRRCLELLGGHFPLGHAFADFLGKLFGHFGSFCCLDLADAPMK